MKVKGLVSDENQVFTSCEPACSVRTEGQKKKKKRDFGILVNWSFITILGLPQKWRQFYQTKLGFPQPTLTNHLRYIIIL